MIAIHIGLKKSGSSTIQHFFSTNRRALRKVSIDFPAVVLSGNNHHNIAQELSGSGRFDPKPGTLSDLVAYRSRKKKRVMFLSAEPFESLDLDAIAKLRSALLPVQQDGNFRIIMIVRDLVDLIPSSYAQKIKFGHHSYDFDTFFKLRKKQARVDYYETAAKWAEVFGWQNLRVRSLDARYLRNGDLIDEILTLLEADPADERVAEMDRAGIRNIRPGWRVLECVRALSNKTHNLPPSHPILFAVAQNAGDKNLGRLAMEAGERMGWNADKGLYLTRKQARECVGIYRDAVERLNKQILEPLPYPQSLSERNFIGRKEALSIASIPRSDVLGFYDLTADLWRQQAVESERLKSDSTNVPPAAEDCVGASAQPSRSPSGQV